jgi:FkbM family methyltransferase
MRIGRGSRLRSYVGRFLLRRIGRRLAASGMPRMAVFAHDTIGDDIILMGRYETDLLSAITEHIVSRALPDHRQLVALDVGANIGNHSLAFSQVFARVLAFEPNPLAVHLLQANVLLNLAHNIAVCPVGLGESDHSAAFCTEPGNVGASHFVSPNEQGSSPGDQSSRDFTTLQIVNGDAYLSNRLSPSERVGLIKIDVEGFEDSVVGGLSAILKRDTPLVFYEALDRAAAEKTASVLRANGYDHYFSIEPDRIPLQPEILRAAMRWVIGSHLHMRRIASFEDRSYGLILACTSDAWLK